jgi:hypothetical protein
MFSFDAFYYQIQIYREAEKEIERNSVFKISKRFLKFGSDNIKNNKI